VSAFSLMFRLAPEGRRGQASGLFTGAFLLGGVTGPAFGGALVTVDLRAPFVVYAVALVAATIVVGTLLARSQQVGVRPPDPDATPLTIAAALRLRSYRAALVSSLATGWAVQGVRVALIPLFVAVALGRAPVWAGIALTVFAVGDGLVLLVTSGLSDRRGRRPVVIAGLALVTAGTAAIALAGPGSAGLVVLLAASAVAGGGAGLLQPAQGAAVADLVGSRRSGGPALSGFQMAADVGAIVGPIAAGALAESASFPAAFALSAGVALVALLVWVRVPATGGSAPEGAGTRAP
jgi:MFS family permease